MNYQFLVKKPQPILLLIIGLLFWGSFKFGFSPLFLTVFFLSIVLIPGLLLYIALKRIDNFLFETVAYGFIYNLILCFTAIILGLNIIQLGILNLSLVFALIVFTFFRSDFSFDLKDLKEFINKNRYFLLIAIVVLGFIIVDISNKGSNFLGDGFFHLAILRKAIDNLPLTVTNLSFTGPAQIHPAYAFPIWHVFLAMIAYLARSNIFNVFIVSAIPLTILILPIWYFLIKRIIPQTQGVQISFLLLLIFTYSFRFGYYFTRLPIPDTLCQYLFLPMLFGLSLDFIFQKGFDWKKITFLGLAQIITLLIHPPQFIYYLIAMFFFGLIFWLFNFKNKDCKEKMIKISLATGISLILIIPAALVLEQKSHLIGQTLRSFWLVNPQNYTLGYAPFTGIEPLAKYAYLSIPLLLLFTKKYRPVAFLLALFLIIPIAYSQTIFVVKWFLLKTVGFITLNRLYSNVTYDFLVWGFFISELYLIIDRKILKKLSSVSIERLNWILGLFGAALISAELKFDAVSRFFGNYLVGPKTMAFLNNNYLLILLVILALTILILVWVPRTEENRSINIISKLNFALFTLIISFIFFSPSFNYLLKEKTIDETFSISKNFTQPRDLSRAIFSFNEVGGQKAVDFVAKNIGQKKYFLVDQISAQTFPLVFDEFIPYFSRTAEEKEVFFALSDDSNESEKDKILDQIKANYIFLSIPSVQGKAYFEKNADKYQNIYDDDIAIYKIIR